MNSPRSGFRVPTATYRLQFNRSFTFVAATDLVGYLHELGISDCYCSPLFAAPPESNHGYDVCDLSRLNPVLGSEEDFFAFSNRLKELGMGLMLDFVPNHMGADPERNPWWRDVLEWGIHSPFANYFDIDWSPAHLPFQHRILLPILADHYNRVLENGEIKVIAQPRDFAIEAQGVTLPLHPCSYRSLLDEMARRLDPSARAAFCQTAELFPVPGGTPDRAATIDAKRQLAELMTIEAVEEAVRETLTSLNGVAGTSSSFGSLHRLLQEQAYRLAFWRSGTRLSNYRRFFEVDSLVALRMERPEVFDAAHDLLLRLVKHGRVTGLRLDHVDGLANPDAYLGKLQSALNASAGNSGDPQPGLYVLVEKITTDGEELRTEWPVAGTTGYEFARDVTALLVCGGAAKDFTSIYETFTGRSEVAEEIARRGKKLVMSLAMIKEIAALGRLLSRCVGPLREFWDLHPDDVTSAIRGTIAHFPVYRTYLQPGLPICLADKNSIVGAIRLAGEEDTEIDPLAFDFLRAVLLRSQHGLSQPLNAEEALFVQRFQQFTGAVMAKGYEDTVFYLYNRLNALNEVGGDPARFGLSPGRFHERNIKRLHSHPHALVTTSTHDTKVSEDVRARLAALSENPEAWHDFLQHARLISEPWKTQVSGKTAPDANEEYLFYQILLATWPLQPLNEEGRVQYIKRLGDYMLKAVNEGKINTRWDRRNPPWEQAVLNFVTRASEAASTDWGAKFLGLAQIIAELGAVNSLSQTLLKLAVPGVPDIYQGNELWQFILVDPDNRRPIDFEPRRQLLRTLNQQSPAHLMDNWRDGAIKMFVQATLLNFRREHPLLFETGNYVPLEAEGLYGECCVAFSRTRANESLIVMAPRLSGRLGFPPLGSRWQSTRLRLEARAKTSYEDIFTKRIHVAGELSLAEVFRDLPVAALFSQSQDEL